jgi:hypothetical protein
MEILYPCLANRIIELTQGFPDTAEDERILRTLANWRELIRARSRTQSLIAPIESDETNV